MYYLKNIENYIANSEETLKSILDKINRNKARIIFVVSEHRKLLGSISDGDMRRWMVDAEKIDLGVPAFKVMNEGCRKGYLDSNKNDIKKLFVDGVDCLPIVDINNHLMQLAFLGRDGFYIEENKIAEDSSCFIIAEVGNNHQGSIKLAKELVDHAVIARADCVKFQMRNSEELYKNESFNSDASTDLGTQYTMDLLSKFQLSNEEMFEIFDYCKAKKIIPLCTPWDKSSLRELEEYGISAYKVASADFTNYDLLEAIVSTEKPFICSTGMASEAEIKNTVEFLDRKGANYVLLHCNSTYPTPFKDVNLKYLTRLKNITGKLVGYSGHERGISIPVGARALGACVIEKHITVDKSLEGNDHKVSLLPNEFKEMVSHIRNLEESLGSAEKPREVTQGELINRENLAKSMIANVDINIGDIIERKMIDVKSPGQGLQPNRISDLVGKKANRQIKKNDFFYNSDIVGVVTKKEKYNFENPVGVPVRFHDYSKITKDVLLDFVEFHLSYKDLEENLDNFFREVQNIGFAVHSPELFSGDHILDLCAKDDSYRQHSIDEFKKVINVTKNINKFFPETCSPVVVLNAGGWNTDGFLGEKEKTEKYDELAKSLAAIDIKDVTVAIQTMPPFPWHFGGQSFHNLFVDADEIIEFCEKNRNIKICLDISHSMMACNYYGWDILTFVKKISPYIVHLHIVDAKGVDGEGVEIGKGDVDFKAIANIIRSEMSKVPFIPEVWQGHKNEGEGFWKALNFLEKIL